MLQHRYSPDDLVGIITLPDHAHELERDIILLEIDLCERNRILRLPIDDRRAHETAVDIVYHRILKPQLVYMGVSQNSQFRADLSLQGVSLGIPGDIIEVAVGEFMLLGVQVFLGSRTLMVQGIQKL